LSGLSDEIAEVSEARQIQRLVIRHIGALALLTDIKAYSLCKNDK
jgi:hypothetical protein